MTTWMDPEARTLSGMGQPQNKHRVTPLRCGPPSRQSRRRGAAGGGQSCHFPDVGFQFNRTERLPETGGSDSHALRRAAHATAVGGTTVSRVFVSPLRKSAELHERPVTHRDALLRGPAPCHREAAARVFASQGNECWSPRAPPRTASPLPAGTPFLRRFSRVQSNREVNELRPTKVSPRTEPASSEQSPRCQRHGTETANGETTGCSRTPELQTPSERACEEHLQGTKRPQWSFPAVISERASCCGT